MPVPKLILVNGLPASGKSTLSKRLSSDLSLPLFSKDDFKELIADTIGYTDHESTRMFGKASFAILFAVAMKCLEKGNSVIIEGNFTLGDETRAFLNYLEECEVETYEILCHADSQLLIERFRNRTQSSQRHPVHHTLSDKEQGEWITRTLSGSGKTELLTSKNVLEVDTSDPRSIDYTAIETFLRN